MLDEQVIRHGLAAAAATGQAGSSAGGEHLYGALAGRVRRRTRRRRAVGGAVLAAGAAAVVGVSVDALAGPGPEQLAGPGATLSGGPAGSPQDQPGPELGQSVQQAELDFEDPEFTAPGPGDLLAPPVRGYRLAGYRNATGAICMAYVGPTSAPTCTPGAEYVAPPGEVHVGGLVPADSDVERGRQPGEPITWGMVPVGTHTVVLQREGETAVEVRAYSGGRKYDGRSFFLAPFSLKRSALTITALDKDGKELGRLSFPERPEQVGAR